MYTYGHTTQTCIIYIYIQLSHVRWAAHALALARPAAVNCGESLHRLLYIHIAPLLDVLRARSKGSAVLTRICTAEFAAAAADFSLWAAAQRWGFSRLLFCRCFSFVFWRLCWIASRENYRCHGCLKLDEWKFAKVYKDDNRDIQIWLLMLLMRGLRISSELLRSM